MMIARFASAIAFAAVLWTFAALPVPAQTAPAAPNVAPADEYFGPLHLSVLGMQNSIAKTDLRLDLAGIDTGDTLKNVALVEASIRDWEAQYPSDTWLPKMVFALHRVYRKIPDAGASLHAVDVAAWLLEKYPVSTEAKIVREEIADQLSPDAGAAAADR
jgi:hypothetical protein